MKDIRNTCAAVALWNYQIHLISMCRCWNSIVSCLLVWEAVGFRFSWDWDDDERLHSIYYFFQAVDVPGKIQPKSKRIRNSNGICCKFCDRSFSKMCEYMVHQRQHTGDLIIIFYPTKMTFFADRNQRNKSKILWKKKVQALILLELFF